MKTGLLINNIGTPESPTRDDVKIYLDEFLMDPDVIGLPYPLRWLLVKGLITPRRSGQSAEKYAKVWTDRGSPLMVGTKDFTDALGKKLGPTWSVKVAMRYGSSSIAQALEELKVEGVDELVFAPMYPQFAKATTGGGTGEFYRLLKKMNWNVPAKVLNAFHEDDRFLNPQADLIRPHLKDFDHVVFSFHGLPESQVRENEGCLKTENCCDRSNACALNCYRAQSVKTARDLATKLGLSADQWSLSFQSRLGPAKWIGPATDDVLAKLAETGKKRIVIACPSFVTDCLETLEEIGLGAREDFLAKGGQSVDLISCLNAEQKWVDSFASLISDQRRLTGAVPVQKDSHPG